MKTFPVLVGLVLLATSVLPVAVAYHIVGSPSGTTAGLTSADWRLPLPKKLFVCESDGVADPRNPNHVGLEGFSGLCYTGRNAVTGVAAPAAAPAGGDITKLDVCDKTVAARGGHAAPCGNGGNTNTVGWDAHVGIYQCYVPAAEALYYNELYAWWSYQGNGAPANSGPGFHGHVDIVIDVGSTPATEGSTVTSTAAAFPVFSSPCGRSPATGPVVRA